MTVDQFAQLKSWAAQTRANAELLPNLSLNRVAQADEAGLWVASLPWPAIAAQSPSLGGKPTYTQPLGQWPGLEESAPRRLLMYGDAGTQAAPDQLNIDLNASPAVPALKPVATDELLAECHDKGFSWERHGMRITSADGEKTVCLAMGLRHAGETHWWEACRLISVEETPFCTTMHMAGSIARVHTDADYLSSFPGYNMPLLHKHNWLTGHLYVRLFANGVIEVFARHINSKFADDGANLEDVVPVVGFKNDDKLQPPADLLGTWDGSKESFELGGVKFDMTEAARLANERYPGSVEIEGDMLVWQPYAGVELFGGICPKNRSGDAWIYRPEQRMFPRGMARTIRFSASFSDRSPKIARYIAPAWWYGMNCELQTAPYLPAHDELDDRLTGSADWTAAHTVDRGFEDGLIARHPLKENLGKEGDPHRHEPGWEGEVGGGFFLHTYRNAASSGERLDEAIRAAYAYTDIAVDHAAKTVRMHGFPFDPPAFAQPMNRTLATTYAWLETGDPYLIQTAQAVVETAYRVHQENFPRLAVGRDASFGRSALLLFRYTGHKLYLEAGREIAMAVAHVQRENGSFGDQGGGTGVHQWGAYITKPWMGALATGPGLDYLDMVPDHPNDEMIRNCIKRFGDWLVANRWKRDDIHGWSYQHDYHGQPRHYDFYRQVWQELPSPGQWHQDNLGRVLTWSTWHTGDRAYLDAFTDSLKTAFDRVGGDHSSSATMFFIPWIQDRLWRATWSDGRLQASPQAISGTLPRTSSIDTPSGLVQLKADESGQLVGAASAHAAE